MALVSLIVLLKCRAYSFIFILALFDHFDVPYLIKLPQSLFERGIPPHEKPPKWNTAEDNFLKKLAEELQFNWPLIADTFNFLRHALITEKRTAIHCYLRYASVWGDHGDGSANKTAISIDADDKNSAAVPPEARPQKHRIFEEWAPTLPNDNFDPKYLRHKFVHRAIKKTMKRRDELMKEKGKHYSKALSQILKPKPFRLSS